MTKYVSYANLTHKRYMMADLANLSTELEVRTQKIVNLKEMGEIPFKARFERTCTIAEAREKLGQQVKIAGRVIFKRVMGKFGFLQIRDIEAKIQVSVGRNELDEEAYDFYKKYVDIADFVGIEGEVYQTQTGEVTVRALKVTLLSKAMRPLPEKFHGLVDTEAKYRQRYLDLIANEDARRVFLGRSKMFTFIRRYLENHGFLEVETPIIQKNISGASAKPFFTKHNALDLECNLRIATETWLKQCIAGGFGRVFELGKDFRNEGMDTTHSPEFTQVEWYASYWDFEDNLKFFQQFLKDLLMECIGTMKVTYQGQEADFSKENWERINYVEKMREILGFDFLSIEDPQEFKDKIVQAGLFKMGELEEYKSVRGLIDFVFKKKIREGIVGPVILYNYPAVLKPLARRNDKDARITDAFQVVVFGAEIVNAYSELVDPMQQRAALEDQLKDKNSGDEEAMDVDEDFLLAIEHGMPPISGAGFGVDRFLMYMYDLPNIRDGILFPLMR